MRNANPIKPLPLKRTECLLGGGEQNCPKLSLGTSRLGLNIS